MNFISPSDAFNKLVLSLLIWKLKKYTSGAILLRVKPSAALSGYWSDIAHQQTPHVRLKTNKKCHIIQKYNAMVTWNGQLRMKLSNNFPLIAEHLENSHITVDSPPICKQYNIIDENNSIYWILFHQDPAVSQMPPFLPVCWWVVHTWKYLYLMNCLGNYLIACETANSQSA